MIFKKLRTFFVVFFLTTTALGGVAVVKQHKIVHFLISQTVQEILAKHDIGTATISEVRPDWRKKTCYLSQINVVLNPKWVKRTGIVSFSLYNVSYTFSNILQLKPSSISIESINFKTKNNLKLHEIFELLKYTLGGFGYLLTKSNYALYIKQGNILKANTNDPLFTFDLVYDLKEAQNDQKIKQSVPSFKKEGIKTLALNWKSLSDKKNKEVRDHGTVTIQNLPDKLLIDNQCHFKEIIKKSTITIDKHKQTFTLSGFVSFLQNLTTDPNASNEKKFDVNMKGTIKKNLEKNDIIEFDLTTLLSQDTSKNTLDVKGTFNEATKEIYGNGTVNFNTVINYIAPFLNPFLTNFNGLKGNCDFQGNLLEILSFFKLPTFTFNGDAFFEEFSFDDGVFHNGHVTLDLDNKNFGAILQAKDLTKDALVITEPIVKLNYGDKKWEITQFNGGTLGGNISLLPLKTDNFTGYQATIDQINLEDVFSLDKNSLFKGKGKLSGTMRLTLNPLRLAYLHLHSSSDQGHITYQPPVGSSSFSSSDGTVLNILKDFHFSTLDITGEPSNNPKNLDELNTTIKVLGFNPNLLNGHSFEMNINITGSLDNWMDHFLKNLSQTQVIDN